MKKIFTLISLFVLALSAQAFTDNWSSSTSATSPVELEHITATFNNDNSGTWTFGNNYAVGSENGQSVTFTTTAAGNLTITFGGSVTTGKKLHMQDADANGLTATLVSNPEVTIEDNANPAADIASGDGVIYSLEANKTYTFSVSGTKWRLASMKYSDVSGDVTTTEWNFSTWADESTGFSNQVLNNLGLLASYLDQESQITNFGKINSSNKGSYTKRFQLGGGGAPLENTGTPTQRFVYFNVNGNSDITVQAIAGGSGDRYLCISDGVNILKRALLSSNLTEVTASYTGDAGVIYIYGEQANNIYDIKATNVGTTVKLDDSKKPTGVQGVKAEGAKAKAVGTVNLAGQKVGADYKGIVVKDGVKVVQ